MKNLKQLKTLFPGEPYSIDGREVKIKSFPWKKFDEVFELIAKYFKEFQGKRAETDTEAEQPEEPESDVDIAMRLLGDGGAQVQADVVSLICYSIDQPADWVETLDFDVVLGLLVEIIALNKDFFSRLGKRLTSELGDSDGQPSKKTGGSAMPASSGGDSDPQNLAS